MTNYSDQHLVMIGADSTEHNRILKIAHTYKEHGYSVLFIGFDRRNTHPSRDTVDGLESEYLIHGFGYSNWNLLLAYPLWILAVFFRCLRLQASVIHVFELETALPVALATLLTRVPFVYDAQDNYDLRRKWIFPMAHVIRWLDGWVQARSGAIIVPDEIRLVPPFDRYRDKVSIIPNCPPDLPVHPERKTNPNQLTVLAMGHLAKTRGIGLLLEAVRQLPDVRVLIAGRFLDPDLEQLAQTMPQVTCRGWVAWDRALALGYEADVTFAFYDPAIRVNVLANAQKWFDSLMTGTPILSNSEIKNAAWLVREDIGYVCTYDVDALVRMLRHIQSNREEAAAKGRRGRQLFLDTYNWSAMTKRLLGAVARARSGGELASDRAVA